MNDVLLQELEPFPANHMSYIHALFDKADRIFFQHRQDDPDLYRKVEERKAIKAANEKKAMTSQATISQEVNHTSVPELPKLIESIELIYFKQSKQEQLKATIRASHQVIHEHHIETQSLIVPRTQARNIKQSLFKDT
jgi:hypothetical protein